MNVNKLLREFVGKVDKDNYREALELQEMIIEEKSKNRIKKASKRSFKTLEEQDEEHATKMKETFRRVDEANAKKLAQVVESLDEKYAQKLEQVLEHIDIEHTKALEQVKEFYEQKLNIKD